MNEPRSGTPTATRRCYRILAAGVLLINITACTLDRATPTGRTGLPPTPASYTPAEPRSCCISNPGPPVTQAHGPCCSAASPP
jgi:hypothetical protein